jgi:phosphosulfolactate phosphohydrolase-like enzyme
MTAQGFEEDLAVCGELDATDMVPLMQGARITLARAASS